MPSPTRSQIASLPPLRPTPRDTVLPDHPDRYCDNELPPKQVFCVCNVDEKRPILAGVGVTFRVGDV